MLDLRTARLCGSCGELTEQLEEGYCPACCAEQQAELDRHNTEFDWWQSLTEKEKDDTLRNS